MRVEGRGTWEDQRLEKSTPIPKVPLILVPSQEGCVTDAGAERPDTEQQGRLTTVGPLKPGVGQTSEAQVCDRPRVYHDEGRLWGLRAMHVVM